MARKKTKHRRRPGQRVREDSELLGADEPVMAIIQVCNVPVATFRPIMKDARRRGIFSAAGAVRWALNEFARDRYYSAPPAFRDGEDGGPEGGEDDVVKPG